MKHKKYFIISAIAIVLGLSALGAKAIYAQNSLGASINPVSNLVNAIAAKFNLNTGDVQAVFDAQRAKMGALRTQNYTDRIKQAVTDGKLTQDQADKILAKKAELETLRFSLNNKTPEERHTTMQEQMNSLKQWAKDSNIPQGYIPFGGREFEMGHGRGGHEMGFKGKGPDLLK